MEEVVLEHVVESLRVYMMELANQTHDLGDAKVIAVSQMLDVCIVKLQRMKMTQFQHNKYHFAH
ncbi:aspartyl-phosphate phosphatase Spo0E family protein [Fodinisporobacter ferrooxydans]|uniref:Aspartyl-phosphate phosphatase Spo0E family protein n=1 Tax=Fodinisporobacter ferrooxydans TaxID=2901836 RepID=A0ABY4CIW0_9BACL|nr:aspartyl-phosphate phosphatase Spo0E family protein [Alicyclobacillaceae bacterium MYW30-H2]